MCGEALDVLLRGAYDFLLLAPVDAAACATVLCVFAQSYFYKNQRFRILHDEVYFRSVATRCTPVALQAAQALFLQKRRRCIFAPVACVAAVTDYPCRAVFLRCILRYSRCCGGGGRRGGRCSAPAYAFQYPFPNCF